MNILAFIIGAVAMWLIAMQISIPDIRRFLGKVHNRWLRSNTIAAICTAGVIGVILCDCLTVGIVATLIAVILAFFLSIVWLWIMSRINTKSFPIAAVLIFIPILMSARFMSKYGVDILSSFAVFGFYYRNCPFGNLFGKRFLLLNSYEGTSEDSFVKEGEIDVDQEFINSLQDFSYAGCHHERKKLSVYDVSKEGIQPDGREDVLPALQQLIDRVGASGGGCIFFPKGRYLLNKNAKSPQCLQINYSNITLEGEIDSNGRPLAELVNCSSTARGERNPWLSPFMITTGEKLQESNMFWGIQFKKKKNLFTRSGSLSDPGSDGKILTPPFATTVVTSAKRGEDKLTVKDASKLRNKKYVMLAMFNREDGDLIRDILDVKDLRPEWKTALRAGPEMAPSYQTLLEIESIDEKNNTVTFTQPLRRDINIENTPELYTVEMLEDVNIRNLVISSKWNGLFCHHGFIVYYSAKQAQEMDYGWNGLNMKRVAHGRVENIIFKNLTNPLYLMDSRNITVENILFCGYDGHQGIKIYEHSCDNLLRHIEFINHYADMMGGEGNAYGNVFSYVRYTNPYLKPVDFDFHGFSEGPMSPPSYNLFENIQGFSHIKGAGALYHQLAWARENLWWNIEMSGGNEIDRLVLDCYSPERRWRKTASALIRVVEYIIRTKKINIKNMRNVFNCRIDEINNLRNDKNAFSPLCTVMGLKTTTRKIIDDEIKVKVYNRSKTVSPVSLYEYQLSKQMSKK